MVLPRWALLTAMVLLSLVFGGCDSSADGEDICCAAHGEAFEASVDGAPWEKRLEPAWVWDLHEGVNQLRVRPCNRFGVRGAVSEMTMVLPS